MALLPGFGAEFANYTSYSRGINGIMIDIAGLFGVPTLADFQFRTGNSSTVDAWPAASAPTSISLRRGAGTGGSDRITPTWDTGAVSKKWLQVRGLATASTGLAIDDVFYFGNAIGEAGNGPGLDASVNATDEILARTNPRGPFSPAPVTNPYDYNRDKQVNTTDQLLARANATGGFTALRLFTAPLTTAGAAPALSFIAGMTAGRETSMVPPGVGMPGASEDSVSSDLVRIFIRRLGDGRIELGSDDSGAAGWRLEMSGDGAVWVGMARPVESERGGAIVWTVDPGEWLSHRFFRIVPLGTDAR